MKTKLAFLAVPFCLGLVLTFVLAACSSDGGNGPDGDSSSSRGGLSSYTSPDEVKCEDEFGTPIINYVGFDVDASYTGRIAIIGSVNSPNAQPIVSLVFTPSNLEISYDGKTGSGISVNTSRVSFGGKTFIELDKASCGENNFDVRACTAKVEGKECCASKNGKFNKTCVSSSSGNVTLSSSSEAVWKFGSKQTATFTGYNSAVTVGSANFILVESGSEDRIRFMNGSGKIGDPEFTLLPPTSDDEPEQGKGYPNSAFSGMGSPVDEMDLENRAFYVIFSGSEPKYLIRFDRIKIGTFPKTIEYWPVTDHP